MTMTETLMSAIPPIDHAEAMTLAAAEYGHFIDQLQTLSEVDWARPTDCELWDVRAMAGHVLGAMEACASIRVNLGQAWRARKRPGPLVDGISAVQVEQRSRLSTNELLERFAAAEPKAIKGRRRTPAPLRKLVRLPAELPGIKETFTLGYMVDTVYTRDTWMHRIDIAKATGRQPSLTAEHDGRVIADIVAEWARRHGQQCTITLDGPAGGSYLTGISSGERYHLDAIEFCRTVAGRTPGAGLLAQPVVF